MNLSPQQKTAVATAAETDSSFVLEAVAGSGKTFTLLRILEVLSGTVCFTAFNKEIASEISEKVKTIQSEADIKVGTRHSFGFGAIRRAFSSVKVDANKLKTLARNSLPTPIIPFAPAAARMAKGFCPENYNEWLAMIDHHNLWDLIPDSFSDQTAIQTAQELLKLSNETTKMIDFEDMIYLPIVHNLRVWQYNTLLLDEAQDTNRAGRMLLKKMMKPDGRIIAVGDPCQAIYGFTGASVNALEEIKRDFNAITLPLSVTYRCPKAVVNYAQKWVNHIESHPDSKDGEIIFQSPSEMLKSIQPGDAIICRNTKPLVETAYSLLRQNIPCKVEGRKIGEGLIKIIKKWKTVKTVSALQTKLEEWSEKEIEKNKTRERYMVCQEIEDKVNTIQIFIEQCDPEDLISVLEEKIKNLFSDNGGSNMVVLSTIHRAKGKEWDNVFCLKMGELSPSKWAKKSWEHVQEENLCYVQVTRSRDKLFIVD